MVRRSYRKWNSTACSLRSLKSKGETAETKRQAELLPPAPTSPIMGNRRSGSQTAEESIRAAIGWEDKPLTNSLLHGFFRSHLLNPCSSVVLLTTAVSARRKGYSHEQNKVPVLKELWSSWRDRI